MGRASTPLYIERDVKMNDVEPVVSRNA